jgi:NAD(P)-dependent dehydrogenase (short-subunit alcohol dehydrogenase family)
MSNVQEEAALVTGRSGGIGVVTATLSAQHGAKVAAHGKDETAASGKVSRAQKTDAGLGRALRRPGRRTGSLSPRS